jgi:hypothetical protein
VKFVGRADDADTDSYSDSDFDRIDYPERTLGTMTEEEKFKVEHNNLELLEKRYKYYYVVIIFFFCNNLSLGRYEGDIYHMTEWQVMVHVIQGRDFAGLDVNPYVCVQIGDEKRYTVIHRCSNSPFFGEVSLPFIHRDFLDNTQYHISLIFFNRY